MFGDDQDKFRFLDSLGTAASRFGTSIYSYCLVDNHYHVLLKADPEPLWRTMHWLGSDYVRFFNRRYGLDGSLWNDRFWSDPVEDDRRLLTVARYIERNALAMRTDETPERYRWSSLGAIAGQRQPPQFLDTNFVLSVFGHSYERFLDFVITRLPSDGEPNSPGPVPSRKPLPAVRSAVTAAIASSDTGDQATERQLVLLLTTGNREVTTRELAFELGLGSQGSARAIRSLARSREATDPAFASLATLARSMLHKAA